MATTTRVLDANVNGTVYTSNANSALEALDTCHSGATAPTNEVANGKLWLDTSTTPGILKIYNNATWEVVQHGADVTVTGAFTSLGIDDNATSTAITIDASGNVLVGTTDLLPADNAVEGFVYKSGLSMQVHRDSGPALGLGLGTSDGAILNFNKDGTTVGSIGINSSRPYFEKAATGGITISSSAGNPLLLPTAGNGALSDNLADVGAASARWDDIYATNGTIQTSDRNEKEAIASLTPTEMLVAARLSSSFKNFKWKDAVAEKGLDAARMHSGIIAQDVQDAFTAEGLDASDYAMFISGTWWEHEGTTYETLEEAPEGATERTRLGVRYPELLAFVAAYNDQRFLSLEARVAALEP